GECYREYQFSKKLLSNQVVDTSYYACIYEVPNETGKEWMQEEQWIKGNPALGTFLPLDNMRLDFKSAKAGGITEQLDFQSRCCNQWVQPNNCFIPFDKWQECKGDIPEDLLEQNEAVLGIDLAKTTDLVGLSWV